MNLILTGISHKTAPVEVRERFAISDKRVPEALRTLEAGARVEEAAILSTCNRVEFILKVRAEHGGQEVMRRFVSSFYGLRYEEFASCFFVHEDYEALRHMFRVASGLDSMLLGEPQVLGQVKNAYALAKEARSVGSLLEAVFHRVFNAAKRVRTETRVAEAPVSVSSAAVELAERVLGALQGKTVMIVGAGQMGELAARHLVSKGAATVLVSNRTYAHAVALAAELGGVAIRFDSLWQAMQQTDIVISSTGCPHYIIARAEMEKLMAARAHRPLFLVDIAVPRDIEPTVREVAGCTLANVDNLQEAARQNLRQREQAIEAAETILAEELARFRERQESLQVVPTIVSLRRRVEEIRRHELASTREFLGELTPEQEEVLENVTQGLVNKILHAPFTELKQAAARPDRREFVDMVRSVFHLDEESTGAALVVN